MGGGTKSFIQVGKPTTNDYTNLGFKPKHILISDVMYYSGHKISLVYDEDYSTTKYRYVYDTGAVTELALGLTGGSQLQITSTGFQVSSTYMPSYYSDRTMILAD